MESILTSIKKLLGIEEEYEHFDADIIIHINSTFSILNQIGVGPENGFTITDKSATWDQYSLDVLSVELTKQFVYLKVKLIFDPPLSSAVMESIKQSISELEWRLSIAAGFPKPR